MSDPPKPNHDSLALALSKLVVGLLITALTSGAVANWLNGETEVKVTANRNVAAQGLYEATWAANQIMELGERVGKLEER